MLVSIIVPVYKSEFTLKRCVDSLVNQDYKELEIILVDDGSPDKSGELCDRLALNDSRIFVIHQKNSGPSCARNLGIEHAKGDYLCFVDSDDYVDNTYISSFIDVLTDSTDLVIQGVNILDKNGAITRKVPTAKSYTAGRVLDGISDINKLSIFGFVYNKLYKSSIIKDNSIRFPIDLSISEDRIFALEYLKHVKELHVVAASTYYYEVLQTGLTMRKRSYVEVKKAADENLRVSLDLLRDNYSECFYNDVKRMYIMSSYGYLRSLFKGNYSGLYIYKEYSLYYNTYFSWQDSYRPFDRSHKVIKAISKLRPRILSFILMSLYWRRKK